jgi:cytoskeletal protein CcmA (bactofilin family)
MIPGNDKAASYTLISQLSRQVVEMFRRKKVELEDVKSHMETNTSSDELGLSGKPGVRPAAALTPGKPPVMPTRPAEPPRAESRPAIEIPRAGSTGTMPGATPAPRKSETEHRKLIVGREIALSGEITSCDRLVVEGSVEANLANCRDIDIADSGLFKGSASIEEAEIRGRFEGTLTVRKRLLIKATGKVVGTIRYGQIEIECGGQISGDVQMMQSAEVVGATPITTPIAQRA